MVREYGYSDDGTVSAAGAQLNANDLYGFSAGANPNVFVLETSGLPEATGFKSANYVADSAGWAIDGAGNAEFNSVKIRGTLYANLIAGWLTATTGGGFRTAASGQRVELANATQDRVNFYSGDTDEYYAAYIISADTSGTLGLHIYSPGQLFGGYLSSSSIHAYAGYVRLQADVTDGVGYHMGGLIVAYDATYPVADNAHKLGTDTYSWLALYAYDIYDNAGVLRLDLSGDWSPAGHIIPAADGSKDLGSSSYGWDQVFADELYATGFGRLFFNASGAGIYTYEGSSMQSRFYAAVGGIASIRDTGSTARLQVLDSGDDRIKIWVGGALKTITIDGSGFLKGT